MLEINFMKDGRRVENFEIQKGVGWQFCMLDGDFKEYGQAAYFKDGEFVVKNDWMSFKALDDCNTIYEVKLSAAEAGEIQFEVPFDVPLFQDSPLREFENEDRKIDMPAFLKNLVQPGKIKICEHVWEWKGETAYTETLEMDIDRESDILRFWVTVTYRPKSEESPQESILRERDSRIKTMTLDGEVAFDFEEYSFMKTMKKVMNYCEKNNLEISVSRKDYMMPGHCIDIPYTIIETERFKIAFEFEKVNMVYITKSIMDNTYYTDTAGGEYNIGAIVREMHKETARGTYIDHGASNICKRVYSDEDDYIFGCWFC